MPGLGRVNMPRSSWAHAPQLLSLCSRAPVLQEEKAPQWEVCAQQLECRCHWPQLEKARGHQQTLSTGKNICIKSAWQQESRPASPNKEQCRAGLGILYESNWDVKPRVTYRRLNELSVESSPVGATNGDPWADPVTVFIVGLGDINRFSPSSLETNHVRAEPVSHGYE